MPTRTDAKLAILTNLPPANSTTHTPALDTAQADPGKTLDCLVELHVPATTTLVDGKTITFTLQDSADGTTFANTDPLITSTITGQTGNGSPEKRLCLRLPPSARRYIRFAINVENGAGNNTATQTTFRILA